MTATAETTTDRQVATGYTDINAYRATLAHAARLARQIPGATLKKNNTLRMAQKTGLRRHADAAERAYDRWADLVCGFNTATAKAAALRTQAEATNARAAEHARLSFPVPTVEV